MTSKMFSGQTASSNAETDHINSTGFLMLKRFLLLAGLLSLGSPAFAAGTIPFSLSQQFDSLGHVLAGCQFYTIQAGTTSTPQSAYQDSALTIALPNPQTCDAAGRLGQMFLADGTIKVRLTDRNGVTQVVADNIQVIGASSGGGSGGTVDPTTILATGDMKVAYGTSVLSGFVRANGRTIGSATSGASERANLDTQALFIYLWAADANLAVSGGRGASATSDYAANKTITLPDARNSVIAGLGDMGNSDRALFSGVTFTTGNSTTLGSSLGASTFTLLTANLPPYTPTGTIGGSATTPVSYWGGTQNLYGGGSFGGPQASGQITINGSSFSFTGTAQGGTSTPLRTVQPTMLATIYIKL